MNEFLNVIRHHYVDFGGRARRREYWMFSLVYGIISLVLYVPVMVGVALAGLADSGSADLEGQLSSGNLPPAALALFLIFGSLLTLFSLALLLPALGVAVRRLHDTGKSGWWLLLSLIPFGIGGLVLLIFYVMEGEPGANRWGPNPKGVADAAALPANNW